MSNNNSKGFFHQALYESGKRIEPSQVVYNTYLNRNESVYELDDSIKKQIIDELGSYQWRNYPMPYYPDIEKLIAGYCGVLPEQVAVAAGSASIITTLINYFAANQRQIVIAQPSFSLYDFHCRTYNIRFDIWPLNQELEYDTSLMPGLKENSLVLFASPNNPVGNIISPEVLEKLLGSNPSSLFLLDEVYNEFSPVAYAPLANKYDNLVLLRSFSKVFSSAGLRAGYIISAPAITEQIRKLILPFSLNHFSVAFLKYVLNNKWAISMQAERNKQLIDERDRFYKELKEIEKGTNKIIAVKSYGNFVLIRFCNEQTFQAFKKKIDEAKIALLDVSNAPGIGQAYRVTIGHPPDNNKVLDILKMVLSTDL
ncbi:MAG: histidinol-phosphate aminotransferase family protein [Bacteroidales bacterium]|nr:histidinol-phosphate aminotransferase family protein [Bacteroidales bacterium]